LDPLANYCISIQATNQAGISAFSNLDCFFLNTPAPPAIHYLSVATVIDNEVELRHIIATGTNISGVQLERYNELNGQFELIGTVPATSSPIIYTDKDVDVQQHSYTYRARIIDSCGGLGTISNYAKTVLLHVTSDQTHKTNQLHWSEYIDFAGDVMFYEVIRGIDGVYTYPPIATVDPDERYYVDDVSQFETSAGKFCYYIIARESENQYHIAENSFSNQVCTAIEPVVYIPNAFSPEGANPLFYPVVSYYDVTEYQFSILDRWGQLIFQSSNPTEAWNGTHSSSNEPLPSGTYSYVLTIKNGLNQEYYYRGGVTLLR
jgi:gliding motility-associated-like protein